MSVFVAVEDQLSRSVVERLVNDCFGNGVDTTELGRNAGGFGFIKSNLQKYVNLSQHQCVIILTDLDHGDCAPNLRADWFQRQRIEEPLPDRMAFCIAVREVEAWLLSDRINFATFLGISPDRIDRNVEESIANPKEYLLNLAKRSRNREVKFDLLPAPRSEATVGMGYNHRLSIFARDC